VLNEAARVRRHVFRRAQVDVAALDVARLAGVRLGGQADPRHRRHPLDRLEHRRRSDRAIHADHRGPPPFELGRKLLRRRAVERVAVLVGRHLGDDRQVRQRADGVERRADLAQVAERFENEQVDAALEQRPHLLQEIFARLVDTGLPPRFDADAERPDRAAHIGPAGRRPPRDLHASDVHLVQAVGEAERSQLDPVGAERIGLEDIGAGADVVVVHALDELGLRQVHRVEALVDEHPTRIQHRPHRAVADEHALFQGI
jgi:hypothetical protein